MRLRLKLRSSPSPSPTSRRPVEQKCGEGVLHMLVCVGGTGRIPVLGIMVRADRRLLLRAWKRDRAGYGDWVLDWVGHRRGGPKVDRYLGFYSPVMAHLMSDGWVVQIVPAYWKNSVMGEVFVYESKRVLETSGGKLSRYFRIRIFLPMIPGGQVDKSRGTKDC